MTNLQLSGPFFGPDGRPQLEGVRTEITLSVSNYDLASAEPTNVDLATTSHRLQLSAGVTGVQSYRVLSAACRSQRANQAYQAVLLFDRSGSIASTDPNGTLIEAGKALVSLVTGSEQVRIAEFQYLPGTAIYRFLSGAFSSNPQQLSLDIDALSNVGGETPLWDAIIGAAGNAGFAAGLFNPKSVVVLSDGDDNRSVGSPASVIDELAPQGTKLYAINLKNPLSRSLDDLAVALGGSFWSSDDASQMPQYARSLRQALLGNSNVCDFVLEVSFSPDNPGAVVGYGPALGTKVPFTFNYDLNGASGIGRNDITIPFFPGERVGVSGAQNVYRSDIDTRQLNSCISVQTSCFGPNDPPRVLNVCSAPVNVVFCDTFNQCVSRKMEPDGPGIVSPIILTALQGAPTTAVCSSERTLEFVPTAGSGASPNISFTPWSGQPEYFCTYANRVPGAVTPVGLGTPPPRDSSCQFQVGSARPASSPAGPQLMEVP